MDRSREAKELGKLDQGAIKLVKEEAWIQAETEHELHDALLLAGFITESEGLKGKWEILFKQLIEEGRAIKLTINNDIWWTAVERIPEIVKVHSDIEVPKSIKIPDKYKSLTKVLKSVWWNYPGAGLRYLDQ